MRLLLRSLSRLVAVCLCAGLALAGLALAVFSIGGDGTISLPALARDLHLPGLVDAAGDQLRRLESGDRPIAWLPLLCGAAAAVGGLALLAGVLLRRRERLFVLEQSDEGRLAARRKPLARLLVALAEQSRGVTQATARLHPRHRRPGGRLTISASRSMTTTDADAVARTSRAIAPVADAFALRTRVHARAGTGSGRLE